MSLSLRSLCVLSLVVLAAAPLCAQEFPREVVLPPENVRYDYAQVLGVRPIYQVLRTTSMERVCDVSENQKKGAISRAVGAVKNRFDRSDSTDEERAAGLDNCRMEAVPREFRRPIAYDVDYVYKGSKFRTRMDRDPGNRLRVRVSITPQPLN